MGYRMVSAVGLAAVFLVAGVGAPMADELSWILPGTGDWFEPSNWGFTPRVPGSSDTASIRSGGPAVIDYGVAEAKSVVVSSTDRTRLLISGGKLEVGQGLYVAGGSGATGALEITGGSAVTPWYSVGSSTRTSVVVHSGGVATTDVLRVGVRYARLSKYYLSGTGELHSRESIVGGDHGRGHFYQSGGTHMVTEALTLGYKSSDEAYYQLDDGVLSTGATFLGTYYGEGDFCQNGGSFSPGYLYLKATQNFTMRGGELSVLDSAHMGGTFDLGDSPNHVTVGGIASFGGTILGGEGTEFSIAPESLVIFPAGFDPYSRFASFANSGLIGHYGSPVLIPAGHSVKGNGAIVDHVYCHGALLHDAAYTGPRDVYPLDNHIHLRRGITIDGGVARLGVRGKLKVNDQISGISDGELETWIMDVAYGEDGQFTQTGGSVAAGELNVGFSNYNTRVNGRYEISDGTLSVQNDLTLGATQGKGTLRQTGGEVIVGEDLVVGTGGHAGPPFGIYQISGGSLSAGRILLGSTFATGIFEVFGGGASIQTGELHVAAPPGGFGQLISHVDDRGLSTIVVTGRADIGGDLWQVVDDGAPFGRWDVVRSGGGIDGHPQVTLPDETWVWGIDGGTTLWVQHVPEPSTITLLAVAAFGLFAWGWRPCLPRTGHRS